MNFNIYNIENQKQNSFREPCRCPKVLIADDEPFNLIALEGFLQCHNIGSIDKVYHGKETLKRVESNMKGNAKSCGKQHVQYKLIMLDKNMPIMDGVDAALIINDWKMSGKVPKETKLVLITGDETIVVKEFDKKIFDYVIMKPVDRSIIEKIIIDAKLL